MIKILARMTLKPGSWEAVTPLFKEIIEKTRQEEGCIEYGLFIDNRDENKCCMVEKWASQEAIDSHLKSEHFTGIFPKISEYNAAPAEVSLMHEFGSK